MDVRAAGAAGSPLPRDFEEALELLDACTTMPSSAVRARMMRLLHPDHCPDPRAADAFARLTALGAKPSVDADVLAQGSIATLHRSSADQVLKVVRDPANNDLLEREADALRTLARSEHRAYFPILVSSSRERGSHGRRANRLTRLDGFVTLAQVRAAYPEGLDPRDAAWMWRRLLVALGAASRASLAHGAVLAEHVMIHPAEHGLVLVGWGQCVTPGQPLRTMVAGSEQSYPPEVTAREPFDASSDLFMSAHLMRSMVAVMPRELDLFARSCMLERSLRPDDGWSLLRDLDDVLEHLWGPRRFRPFTMPEPAPGAPTGHPR